MQLDSGLLTLFLAREFFYTEDRGDTPPNVGTQNLRPTRLHIPEDGILHSHRCENLKSYNWELPGETFKFDQLRKKYAITAPITALASLHTQTTSS
jgi:hypothetical protein